MEKYLIEQYDVLEDRYLTSEIGIVDYFRDCGTDYMDCGQGYYSDEANVICKISDRFYNVKIKADIASAKQDVGDRLYWVDYISSVTYEEIGKPQPKDTMEMAYHLIITADQKRVLESFMRENHIEF